MARTGLGEVGGAYDTAGTGRELLTDRLLLTADSSQLDSGGTLVLGLYHPTVTGKGLGTLVFDVNVNGRTCCTRVLAA